MAMSYCQTKLDSCYRSRELEKRRCYEERVREVERGTFAPLAFTTSGGAAPAAAAVYKRLSSLIAEKKKQPYRHQPDPLLVIICIDQISHSMPERISLLSRTAKITLHDRGYSAGQC